MLLQLLQCLVPTPPLPPAIASSTEYPPRACLWSLVLFVSALPVLEGRHRRHLIRYLAIPCQTLPPAAILPIGPVCASQLPDARLPSCRTAALPPQTLEGTCLGLASGPVPY